MKKLATYISIIFLMVCGTGFMLYQNKKLTAYKPTNINAPIVFNNPEPAAPAAVNNQAAAGSDQAKNINKINQSGGLNLNIFLSDKFKNLRTNASLIKEQPEVGKRDPFRPN